MMETIIGTALVLFICLGVSGLKIDREYQRGVIFRLGRMKSVRGPGMYWIIPVLDQKKKVDIRTKTVDIQPQETITADSVTIKVNAVLYYRLIDPDKAINKVENYERAVYQTALTTLRNVVGQNILDDVLQNRDKINNTIQEIVDEVTGPWGVVIERVEMKDVEIPPSMQRAMAKEAEAVREKRARLIKAAAEQEASIKLAEASQKIVENPAALELRRLQMLTEIGAENNTTTVLMMPSDFLMMAKNLSDAAQAPDKSQTQPAEKQETVISETGSPRSLQESSSIMLKPLRKKNSKRKESSCFEYIQKVTIKQVETCFSRITNLFPKSIHAVTSKGLELKIILFIIAFCIQFL